MLINISLPKPLPLPHLGYSRRYPFPVPLATFSTYFRPQFLLPSLSWNNPAPRVNAQLARGSDTTTGLRQAKHTIIEGWRTVQAMTALVDGAMLVHCNIVECPEQDEIRGLGGPRSRRSWNNNKGATILRTAALSGVECEGRGLQRKSRFEELHEYGDTVRARR